MRKLFLNLLNNLGVGLVLTMFVMLILAIVSTVMILTGSYGGTQM